MSPFRANLHVTRPNQPANPVTICQHISSHNRKRGQLLQIHPHKRSEAAETGPVRHYYLGVDAETIESFILADPVVSIRGAKIVVFRQR